MPNTQSFEDINALYREFMQSFYGDKPLETSYEREFYGEQQRLLGLRRKRMQERVMERLSAQGITASGVGADIITEQVEVPISRAEGALDFQRIERKRAEMRRREEIGRGMAMTEWQRQEEERKRKSGFLGKLFGGAASGAITGFMAGGPWGALGGAGLGLLGAGFGGSGGDDDLPDGAGYNEYLEWYLNWLEKNSPGGENGEENGGEV